MSILLQLEAQPKSGTPIGNDCYKIRMTISSKGKGKSGGARVITHVHILMKLFICFLSTINQKPKIFPIK
jgi:hypothetical protein